jgi:N-acetylglucosamine kinase-like BadF-type ATPase
VLDPVAVAIDGGADHTDAVAVARDGTVRARSAGPGCSPRLLGVVDATAVVDHAVQDLLARLADVGTPVAVHTYVSGVNSADDAASFRARLASAPWAPEDPAMLVVAGDMPALLHSGTDAPDAVAVCCGTGINALGVRAGGRAVTFRAMGPLTGDWGGGWELGQQAMWHAARAVDGRGPATSLVAAIPEVFGMHTLSEVVSALQQDRMPHASLRLLCPSIMRGADAADQVCGELLDRQAAEIVTMAVTVLRRLDLPDAAVPVVLGGGVITAGNERLTRGILAGMIERAPHAMPTIPTVSPIAGAGVLAVGAIGGNSSERARVRDWFTRMDSTGR